MVDARCLPLPHPPTDEDGDVDPRLCIEGSFVGALDKGTLDAILSAAAAGEEGGGEEGSSEKALEDARRIFQGVRTAQAVRGQWPY